MTLPQSALEQPRRPNHTTLSQLYGLTGGVVRRHRAEAPFRSATRVVAVLALPGAADGRTESLG